MGWWAVIAAWAGPVDVDLSIGAPPVEAPSLAALTGPLDHQLAVASALGVGQAGRARAYLDALAARRSSKVSELRIPDLTAPERAVLAWLLAREDPREPAPIEEGATGLLGMDPAAIAASARADRPDDFAIAAVATLVGGPPEACAAWRAWVGVLAQFQGPARNLAPATVDAITTALRPASTCPP
ncbi:MAG: hypothetical protein ABMA64_33145 [Myxococcota bacterium]